MYVITEWFERYEVNDEGRAAKKGDTLRKFGLKHVRCRVHGRSMSAGFSAMMELAGDATYSVFGIFIKLLEVAGCEIAGRRGMLLNHQGKPATATDLAFYLKIPVAKMQSALDILTNTQVQWVAEVADNFAEKRGETRTSAGKRGALYNTVESKSKRNTTVNQGRRTRGRAHARESDLPQEPSPEQTTDSTLLAPSASTRFDTTTKGRLDFGNALRGKLCPRSNADFTALWNFQHWVDQQGDPELYGRVLQIAADCKNGRKPIAVFFSRVDDLGYRARAEADKRKQ